MWLNVEKGFKRMIAEKATHSIIGLGPSSSSSPMKKMRSRTQVGSPSPSPRKRIPKDPNAPLDNGFGLRPYKVVHPDSSESRK